MSEQDPQIVIGATKLVVEADAATTSSSEALDVAHELDKARELGALVVEVDTDTTEGLPEIESEELPSKEFVKRISKRFQRSFDGEYGSTCLINSLAVAFARTSDSPGIRPELGIAERFTRDMTRAPDGQFYALGAVGNVLPSVIPDNIETITRGADSKLSLMEEGLIDMVLGYYGSVVFVDRTPGRLEHAAALIGKRTQTDGTLEYLMYDGAPQERIGGLPEVAEAVRWITREQLLQISANQPDPRGLVGFAFERKLSDEQVRPSAI